MDLLEHHLEAGEIEIDSDEITLVAEQFLAMVEALPSRLAEFGVFRTSKQAARYLQYAVKLILGAIAPTGHTAKPARPAAIAKASKTSGATTRRRRTPAR